MLARDKSPSLHSSARGCCGKSLGGGQRRALDHRWEREPAHPLASCPSSLCLSLAPAPVSVSRCRCAALRGLRACLCFINAGSFHNVAAPGLSPLVHYRFIRTGGDCGVLATAIIRRSSIFSSPPPSPPSPPPPPDRTHLLDH